MRASQQVRWRPACVSCTSDKQRIENAIYQQAHIHCDIAFDESGTAVITPRGKDIGDKAAFYVARSIATQMGFPNAKQGK